MPITASQIPTKIAMIREKDILVLQRILEGKLACRDPCSRANGQMITTRLFLPRATYSGRAAPDPRAWRKNGLFSAILGLKLPRCLGIQVWEGPPGLGHTIAHPIGGSKRSIIRGLRPRAV